MELENIVANTVYLKAREGERWWREKSYEIFRINSFSSRISTNL